MDVNVSRRQLLGIGAAAGAATIAAMNVHLPIAAADDGALHVDSRQLPNYTAITPLAGLQATTLGYADFHALSSSSTSATVYADPPSVYNANGTAVQTSLRLAVGAVLRRVDFFAFRGPSATGNMVFNLYRTTVPTSATRNTLGTANLTGTGEVQGVFDLGTGLTIGLGDVITLEALATDLQNRVVGSVYQYAPAGGIYVSIAPKRVYDSRLDAAGKLAVGATRTVSVANQIASQGGMANVVPAGATGIAYNLTVTETEAVFGYLTVVAGGGDASGPSSINWDHAAATVANGLQGPVNTSREVKVLAGGAATAKTHFLIDVLGYYL